NYSRTGHVRTCPAMRFFVKAREMGMRFRHAMSALMPFGAASALAILPVGASTAAHATTVTGHMTPAVSSPLAYKFVGTASSLSAGSADMFTCQEPGAALNCYTPQELAK